MTVYLDEVFAVNLCMDWLILWATGTLAQSGAKRWRLGMAAFLGALYSIVIFLPWGVYLAILPAKILCSLLMIVVAFPFVSWRNYLKNVIYLYLISFVLGGASLGVMYLFGQQFVETWNGIALVQIDFQFFWLAVAVSLVLAATFFLRQHLRRDLSAAPCIVTAQILMAEKQVSLRLLVDTGNSLVDPLTAQPVIVAEQEHLLPLFSPLFAQQLAQTASGSAQLLLAAQQSEMPGRWRLIPYRAVGQQGMLLGFRPDWVILQHGKEYRRYSNVIVALSEQKFSAYETYQGLVPPELL